MSGRVEGARPRLCVWRGRYRLTQGKSRRKPGRAAHRAPRVQHVGECPTRVQRDSRDDGEPRVRSFFTSCLVLWLAIHAHDVGSEVVMAVEQRRTDAIRIDGHAGLLECANLLDSKSTGD